MTAYAAAASISRWRMDRVVLYTSEVVDPATVSLGWHVMDLIQVDCWLAVVEVEIMASEASR
jgi:hypothetical protein